MLGHFAVVLLWHDPEGLDEAGTEESKMATVKRGVERTEIEN